LDEWVEKKTALSRSSARALIQIYDAIVKSGVELAKVKHLEWTKLRAIAGVLDGENADHWIEMASSHSIDSGFRRAISCDFAAILLRPIRLRIG
jgi:hypothetical protein